MTILDSWVPWLGKLQYSVIHATLVATNMLYDALLSNEGYSTELLLLYLHLRVSLQDTMVIRALFNTVQCYGLSTIHEF